MHTLYVVCTASMAMSVCIILCHQMFCLGDVCKVLLVLCSLHINYAIKILLYFRQVMNS